MQSINIVEKSDEQRYTLGVVYEPSVVDTQGDYTDAETIEKAAWDFLARLQRCALAGEAVAKAYDSGEDTLVDVTELVEMHKSVSDGLDVDHDQTSESVGTVVESYIAPSDMTIGDLKVKKGAWLLGVVWEYDVFARIKKGELSGLSLFGNALRV